MLNLPNGCTCSELNVFPKNWKTNKASLAKPWYITYRFYDPLARQEYPHGKLVQIKGMNAVKTVKERRDITELLLNNELSNLKDKGYNPITKVNTVELQQEAWQIHPRTPFIKALEEACKLLKVQDKAKADIKSILKYCQQAATILRIVDMPIEEIKRKHIRMVFDECERKNQKWSANLFNHYRRYLSSLYAMLVELEAVPYNPVKDIKKQPTIKKDRQVLSSEQRAAVNKFLEEKHPTFHRFTHIFFHSGARLTEMMKLKGRDIDLPGQRFKVTIIKGNAQREAWKEIKDIAMEYWRAQMAFCGPDDYVFSKDLEPGTKQIQSYQITKRWYRLVKQNKELNITADFYSLKHLNLDEVAAALDINEAASAAGHTSPVITMNVYAQGEKSRQGEKRRKVANKFA